MIISLIARLVVVPTLTFGIAAGVCHGQRRMWDCMRSGPLMKSSMISAGAVSILDALVLGWGPAAPTVGATPTEGGVAVSAGWRF